MQRIRGPKDTIVVLTVWRGINTINPDSDQKPEVLTIEVVRGEILYPSVIGEVRDIDGYNVAHITISSVGDHTQELFRQVIMEKRTKDVDAVVLDLRGNG